MIVNLWLVALCIGDIEAGSHCFKIFLKVNLYMMEFSIATPDDFGIRPQDLQLSRRNCYNEGNKEFGEGILQTFAIKYINDLIDDCFHCS